MIREVVEASKDQLRLKVKEGHCLVRIYWLVLQSETPIELSIVSSVFLRVKLRLTFIIRNDVISEEQEKHVQLSMSPHEVQNIF